MQVLYVRLQTHADRAPYLESVSQQQIFALRIDWAAPCVAAVPGPADLEALERRPDVQVSRAANDVAARAQDYSERHLRTAVARIERVLHPTLEHRWIAQVVRQPRPELVVLSRRVKAAGVVRQQRLEPDMCAFEGDRDERWHAIHVAASCPGTNRVTDLHGGSRVECRDGPLGTIQRVERDDDASGATTTAPHRAKHRCSVRERA